MNKHIQIRNVPPSLHRRLKMRAASEGQPLSDYLREELSRLVDTPTLSEWAEMVRRQQSANAGADAVVNAIRQGREENDAGFDALPRGRK
jgi:plasmid stability protein